MLIWRSINIRSLYCAALSFKLRVIFVNGVNWWMSGTPVSRGFSLSRNSRVFLYRYSFKKHKVSLWWTFPASSGPRLVRRPMVSLRHTHTCRTSTMSSRPLSSVSVGTRGVPGNYTTGWITCRSIDCRSIDCRSIDCRSNDCRSIDCRINGTTPD